MRSTLYIMVFLFDFLVSGNAQMVKKQDKAFKGTYNEQRPMLLVFSGSDWCLPCIRFEKIILTDTAFLRFTNDSLELLLVDFPQRKKRSTKIQSENESLAEKYNPNGVFPLLLLLNADRTVLTSIEFINQSPREFIHEISVFLHSVNMQKEHSRNLKLMGSAFGFIVVTDNDNTGELLLDESIAEVRRIEALLTEFSTDSQTALLNQHAGIKEVNVEKETYDLIERCKHISKLTDGAFDISAGALKKLYNFKGNDFIFPGKKAIEEALEKTGYEKIKMLPSWKIFLEAKGMHIGFGGIGKGYAADKVKEMLQSKGVQGAVINASGDLTAWGLRANGEPWKVGIAHPDDPARIILWLPINNVSVATSGNYIQYFDYHGTRYSHNIDPKTGYPVKGIKSVTVISPGAALSDALATAVTVMGRKAGLFLINQLPQTHCIIVDDNNEVFSSKQINIQHAI